MKVVNRISLLAVLMLAFAFSAFAQNVTVNPGAGSYTTLSAAFAAINAGTHTGAVTVDITASTTETATATLNAGNIAPANYTSVVVRPTAPGLTVSGTIIGAIIRLNGADNVTIDGRVGGTGTSRDLSVINNSTAAATAAVWLSSVAAGNGATNNIVRNLEIACGAPQNTGTNATIGILMGGTTISTSANGIDNDNNQFVANRIIRSRFGIVTRGTTTDLNIAPIVTDNIVGPAAFGADQIGQTGIFMQADTGATVSRNTVQFVGGTFATTTGGADRVGIAIGTNSWSATDVSTLTSNSYTVTRNIINNVVEERTFSAAGIKLGTTQGGGATNNLVANNFILNVRANGTSGDQLVGIGIAGGNGDRIVFNSLSITGDVDPAGAAASSQYGNAIRIPGPNAANNANFNIQNNSIYLDVNSNTATISFYAITLNSTAYSFGTGALNYNNYYIIQANPQLFTAGFSTGSTQPTAALSFKTLADFIAGYPGQNANSIQADPLYVSNTSDLHIPAASPNADMGIAIAGVTNDIDGENRVDTPDIGADEQDGVAPPANDIAAAAITTPANGATIGTGTTVMPQATFTNVGTATQTNVQVTFTITGPGGYNYTDTQTIATIAPNQTVTVTFAATPAFTAAGTYTSTATVTTPDGNTANNTVTNTFTVVLANDIAANAIIVPANGALVGTGTTITPQATFTNVGTATQTNVMVTFTITGPGGYNYTDTQTIATIAPGATVTVTFAVTPAFTTAGTYTSTASVTTPDNNAANNSITNTFSVVAPVTGGTVNVGAGESFTSLTNPGGLFANLNAAGATGNIVVNITSDLTGETGSVFLNQLAAGITVTIKPSGAPRTITSTTTAGRLLGFNGADNVTIDGSLTTGGTTRDLTLTVTNTTTGSAVVDVRSQGTGAGATNFTLKNTIVNGGATSSDGVVTTFGIFVGAASGAAAGADNDNLTIINNLIQRTRIGIQAVGVATTGLNDNTIITGNTFGGTAATDFIGQVAINIGQTTNSGVRANTVRNIFNTAAIDAFGIIVGAGSTNTTVLSNIVTNIETERTTGTIDYGATGINIATGAAASNITVANNMVSDIRGESSTVTFLGDTVVGIRITGTNTGGINVYYNSVNLFGAYPGFNGATITAAFMVNATTPTALDVRNNIFVNSFDNTTVTTDKNYAIYTNVASTVFTPIDYNDYFVSGAQGVLGAINSVDVATLPALQTATAQDANSLSVDPLFVSATDLHLQMGSPLIGVGTPIPAVTDDFDGQTRPMGVGVEIGADEVTAPTAATATIRGRVSIGRGNGIRNVTVTMTGGGLQQPITTTTGVNGSYQFPGVPVGQTYVIEVSARRYTFNQSTRVIGLTEDLTDVNFIGEPIGLRGGGSLLGQ